MKLTSYFIKHPVMSIILNSMIVVLGALCLHHLSVREYPDITFPTISVSTGFSNASPELVETAVTNPLEDKLAGIEGLDTITSQSSAGYSEITLLFHAGTSMDKALTATQNAVGVAKSLLPVNVTPVVDRQRKSSGLPFIGLLLESSTMRFGELTHYAHLHLKNSFRSVQGVASVDVWGQPHTYTITLDPKKLYSFGINVDDVTGAIANSQISLPAGKYQNKIPSTLNASLKTEKDFENLLIKTTANPVLLKSLGRVKLETDHNQTRIRVNGHAGVVLSINRAADANPLEVSNNVQHLLTAIQKNLPQGLKINVIINQSDFINASIANIRSSILEAIVLVLIIVFVFLRNVRATLIPLITIPISLLGSLLFLKACGFSINLMTLLAMVLAIGLVVDDAIIVLENSWRHIENGLSPAHAAIKGAREIAFAIIAMTFTLGSVYLPIAFMQGMLGQLFREFAVALAGSVLISGVVALTLSPLMCSRLLTLHTKHWIPQFDSFLARLTKGYTKILNLVLKKPLVLLMVALFSILASFYLYAIIEQETAPKEDRGLIGLYAPAVAGEDMDTLDNKITALEKTLQTLPESEHHLVFIGDWGASIVIPLKPHANRTRSANQIVEELRPQFNHFPSYDPQIWSWDTGLPGIDNAGTSSGLALVISTTDTYQALFDEMEKLKTQLENTKQFESVRTELQLNTMGYSIDIDYNQLAALGIKASQVAKTIEVFFSGDKSQSFEKEGIRYNVSIQGILSPWTLNELYITTPKGRRVSLGAFTQLKPTALPAQLDHTQQMRSTVLYAELKKGDTLAKASERLVTLTKNQLPDQYKLTWTGSVKALNEASNQMFYLVLLALVFIYAILSLQFENFIDPFIILVTVPLACTGGLLCTWLWGQTLNIYTQVGLITLMGLISKHGILIIEFANQRCKEGVSLRDAVQQAAILRLRPVLMTTGAMVFGAIPLVLSHAAGAEARHAMGTVLIGGLCLGTVFTLLVLPAVYCMIKSILRP